MSDEPGVLGNLPRERPGRRSEKRAAGGPPPDRSGRASKTGAARPKRTASPRSAAAAKRGTGRAPRPTPPARQTDPLTGALKLAGKVAGVGLKTAGGVLRRLPGR